MKYGLIGHPLGHSYSKVIHGFFGNDAYEICDLAPSRLADFFAAPDFCGVNVTIPHKKAVMLYCELSEAARRIGSVNTIVKRGGALLGYNTDYAGFLYLARRADISFSGQKVIILGSGGTSRMAALAALDCSARAVVTLSRGATGDGTRPHPCDKMRGEILGCRAEMDSYQNIARHADADILINTTPVGMYPHNAGLPPVLDALPRLSAVIDVIYNPGKTRLVLEAEKRGIRAVGGLPMLVAQAYYANELFFDHAATGAGTHDTAPSPVAEIELALQKAQRLFANIVLIGMPGSGKTTLGRALAKRLGLRFVDTDEEIAARAGKPPADIITERGETAFRRLESDVVFEIAKENGCVIATGGGSVLAEQNRDALRQNGPVLFVDRALSRLATEGRPLSLNTDALEVMAGARRPIYEAMCDARLSISENFHGDLATLLEIAGRD